MNADSSPGNQSEKRAILPGCTAMILQLLRMFWLTVLALLMVVLYGLRAGWSVPQQWSDGFFIAAFAQWIIAAIMMLGTPGEALDAASLRYVANSDITETRLQLFLDTLRKRKFGIRAGIGGLLTILIAAVLLWV
jgi:hypothetical protein